MQVRHGGQACLVLSWLQLAHSWCLPSLAQLLQPITPLRWHPARPPPPSQLVHVADKVYGVSHTNRLSRIDTITRDDALTFLAT